MFMQSLNVFWVINLSQTIMIAFYLLCGPWCKHSWDKNCKFQNRKVLDLLSAHKIFYSQSFLMVLWSFLCYQLVQTDILKICSYMFHFFHWLGPWSWDARLDSISHLTIIWVRDLPFFKHCPHLFLSGPQVSTLVWVFNGANGFKAAL